MPSDPVKAFLFLFYLQITFGIESRKERSSQTCKGRKRERERMTHRRAKGERSRRRLRSREASIAILRIVDRNLAKHRADRNPSSNPVVSLCSFFSQFDRIWWFFYGFCLCFCTEEWMILYIYLAIEKMWVTSRKCVFYGIFKNTTKH